VEDPRWTAGLHFVENIVYFSISPLSIQFTRNCMHASSGNDTPQIQKLFLRALRNLLIEIKMEPAVFDHAREYFPINATNNDRATNFSANYFSMRACFYVRSPLRAGVLDHIPLSIRGSCRHKGAASVCRSAAGQQRPRGDLAGKTRKEQDGSGSRGILNTGSPRSERGQVLLSYYGSSIRVRDRDLVFLFYRDHRDGFLNPRDCNSPRVSRLCAYRQFYQRPPPFSLFLSLSVSISTARCS